MPLSIRRWALGAAAAIANVQAFRGICCSDAIRVGRLVDLLRRLLRSTCKQHPRASRSRDVVRAWQQQQQQHCRVPALALQLASVKAEGLAQGVGDAAVADGAVEDAGRDRLAHHVQPRLAKEPGQEGWDLQQGEAGGERQSGWAGVVVWAAASYSVTGKRPAADQPTGTQLPVSLRQPPWGPGAPQVGANHFRLCVRRLRYLRQQVGSSQMSNCKYWNSRDRHSWRDPARCRHTSQLKHALNQGRQPHPDLAAILAEGPAEGIRGWGRCCQRGEREEQRSSGAAACHGFVRCLASIQCGR